jgi:hypothetical protein
MKWQMLEGVQRVVVNENPNRSLGGQEMRGMFDRLREGFEFRGSGLDL